MNEKLNSRWSLKKPYLVKEGDKRYKRCLKELKENGFSYDETWSLDSVVSEFVLPRLKLFKQVNNGFPGGLTESGWNEIIDKMIFAFEWNMADTNMTEMYIKASEEEKKANWEKYSEGMDLFAKYFRDLWW